MMIITRCCSLAPCVGSPSCCASTAPASQPASYSSSYEGCSSRTLPSRKHALEKRLTELSLTRSAQGRQWNEIAHWRTHGTSAGCLHVRRQP
ncbi:hypothetical protein PF005_g31193, partial [Phytophthora fragariae]